MYIKFTYQFILDKLENESSTVTDVWKKFSIFDCINHVASAVAEVKPHTLNACRKAVWPGYVTNNTTNENSKLLSEIITLAHGIGGEGFSTFNENDVNELLVENVLNDDDVITISVDNVDNGEILDIDSEVEDKPVSITASKIREDKFKLEARDENNSLSQTIPDKPIELRHFVKLCEQRRKFAVLYKLEFQTAIKVETNTCRHATRKNNAEKNQNQKCIPYDYNRVVLEKLDGVADSDYVNASYVDSLLKPNAYIVTQGPTEETVLNFWRMIWQENVSCIVMLTKTFDFTKVMCVQYWPPSKDKDESYGDIFLGIAKEEQLANFHIRTFHVYKKNGDKIIEERELLQFHYTEWHSHTCPFSNAILEFRRRVRSVVGNIIKANSHVGPMLVHCNDGGGRSGVYLAIDANMELAEEEDCFHVYGYLKRLRQSRKGLIENVDQYKFVYDTLEEYIVCGNSWFPVTQLSERLKQKSQKEPVTKMNEYQREYAQICKQTPRFSIGDCAGGHRADNREKNRDVLCVPPDNFRPYLTSFQGNAFTDYINCVFVDGYTRPREYIVTEWPLKQTLGEFWSLVYDHECSAVVVLCQPPHNSQQYPSFWPESKTPKKYGPVFTVGHRSHHHYTNIKTWLFEINKKIISLTELMAGVKAPSKTVQLFQLTCWPMGHKVPSSTNSLVALMNMVERWRQRSDYGPVCVVSPDGRSRSGVYCAANACIEQVIQHGEVDIFQAVKTVRRHRPQLVENITEYKYCYDLVLHYVLHYLNKDLKEKKFIEFGRGKSIPLTPENSNSDLPNEMSNAGRIVVKKRISKIDKCESFNNCDNNIINNSLIGFSGGLILNSNLIGNPNSNTSNCNVLKKQASLMLDKHGKVVERKKKGRLYSLGGNDPPKSKHRGRLDRLKTVGTFDLGAEMCVLSEVARHLNERIITTTEPKKSNDECNMDSSCNLNNNLSNLSPVNSIAGSIIQGSKSGLNTPQPGVRHDSLNIINNNKSICVPTTHQQQQQPPQPHSPQQPLEQNTLFDGKQQSKIRSLSTGSYLSSNNSSHSNSTILNKIEIDNPNECVNTAANHYQQHQHQHHHLTSSSSCNNTILRSRKPQLRKSKRIMRSDSEILIDDTSPLNNSNSNSNEIILNINTDIQIHQEHNSSIDDDVSSRPLPKSRLSSGEPNTRELLKSTTDESSRNISTDELDTVFSDSRTDLEQLEKDYRENIKSNLTQREYKSDGDTLDEIGRKRNEFGKWKNQSFDTDIDCFPIIEINNNNNNSNNNSNDTNSSNINRPSDLEIKLNSINSRSIISTVAPLLPITLKPSSEGSITSLLEKRFGKFKRMNKLLKSKRFSTSILYEKNKIKSTSNIMRTEEVIRIPNSYQDHNHQPHFYKTTERRQSKVNLFQMPRKSSIISGHSSLSNNELNLNLNNCSSSSSSIKNTSNDIHSKSHTEINSSKLSLFRSSPFHFNTKKLKASKTVDSTKTYNKTISSPLSEEFYNKTGSVRLSAVELFEKFCSEDFGGLYKHEMATTTMSLLGHSSGSTASSVHNQRISERGLGAIRKYTTQRAQNMNENQNHPPRLLKQKSEPKFLLRNTDNSEMKEVMYYHEEDEEDEQEVEIYSNEDEEEYESDDDDDNDNEYEYEGDDDEIENDEEVDEIYLMPEPVMMPIELDRPPPPPPQPSLFQHNIHNTNKSQLNSKILGSSSSSRPPLIRVAGIDRSLNNLNHTNDMNEFNFNFDNDDEILTIYRIYSKNDIINLTNSDLNLNTNTSMIENTERNTNLTKSTPSFLNYINNGNDFNQFDNNHSNNNNREVIDDFEQPKLDPNFIKTNIVDNFNDSFELLSCNNNRSGSTITSIDYCFDTVKNINLDSCSTSKLSLSLKSEIFDEFTITPDDLKMSSYNNNSNINGATRKTCEIEDFTLTPDENSYNDDIIIGDDEDDNDDDDDQNEYSSKEYDKSSNIEKVIKLVDRFIINEKNSSSNTDTATTDGTTDTNAATAFLQQNQINLNLNNKNIFNFENLKLLKLSTSTEYNDSSENPETEIDDDGCDENKISSYTNKITKEFDLLFYRAEEESKILLNNNNNNNNNSDHSYHNNSNNRIPTRYSMQKLEPITILDYPSGNTTNKPINDDDNDDVDDVDDNGDAGTRDDKTMYRDTNTKKSRNLCARLTTHRSQSLGNLNKKTRCFPL